MSSGRWSLAFVVLVAQAGLLGGETLPPYYAKKATWHETLADPTIADAICDRLVHNAHVLWLKGPSMRKKKGLDSKDQSTTT